jgi:predicted HAD superfamily Cof-like phosphohydrolase
MFNSVKQFHETYGANISTNPAFPSAEERNLRIALLQEEFNEYLEAERDNDFIEVCDALGDMLYIIFGTAVSYGIPINEIFAEIHASNMSKLAEDGTVIRREDGKVLKGPNYFKPDIKKIVDAHIKYSHQLLRN